MREWVEPDSKSAFSKRLAKLDELPGLADMFTKCRDEKGMKKCIIRAI